MTERHGYDGACRGYWLTADGQQMPCSCSEAAAALTEALTEHGQPSRDMVIWWNLLRPDRLSIARALDKSARDYDHADLREAGRALREAARWVRASAGDTDA